MKTFSAAIAVMMLLVTSIMMFTSVARVEAQGGQVILKPTDDTYVFSEIPTANYGSAQMLRVCLAYYWTWLKFDLSTIPKGAVGIFALLELCTTYDGVVSPFFVVACLPLLNKTVSTSWSEANLTCDSVWDGFYMGDVELDTDYVANNEVWYEWNVTQAVVNATTSNSTDVTIIMRYPYPEDATPVAFISKEASFTKAPKLTVSWTDAVPEFPSLVILPLFMIATLLAVMVYRKKSQLSRI